ncbi:hypothetical protein AGMMS49991_00630 [Spirochaetia bacterium]|nr:hypothetical protein AGMMS49991_00630 [Spirochaetia bacterium]
MSAGFFLIFFGCCVIALAGPRWGFHLVPEFRRGVDVVLAIDLSLSMEVRDGGTASDGGVGASVGGRPSRLERASAIAGEVVSAGMMGDGQYGGTGRGAQEQSSPDVTGIRYAATIGKGAGILAVPLTSDLEAVLTFLEGLSSSTVTGRGTNLENLIDAAAGAFKDTFPGKRRIILFSDGESLQGNFAAAVDRALAADIAITAVGLGTETGGIVPGNSQGDQSPITSFLRRDTLQSAAGRTGGIYIDGGRADAAEKLAEHLASHVFETRSGAFRREVRSRRHIFILAALAALGVSKMLEKKRKRSYGSLIALIIITLNSCSQIPGRLRVIEGSFLNARGQYPGAISAYLDARVAAEAAPYAEYGLGVIYLAMDEAEAALNQFAAAGESAERALGRDDHAELTFRLHYNTGVIRFRQGDYAAAAGDFRRALEAEGGHIEAKRNLELSLLSLTRQGREQASIAEGDGERGGSEALFDYMHKKEADRWKSREWAEDTDVSGPDY